MLEGLGLPDVFWFFFGLLEVKQFKEKTSACSENVKARHVEVCEGD